MKVLFIVPRFHTNLFFATKALVQAGIEVDIFCSSAHTLEDHSFVKPVIITNQRLQWREISRLLHTSDPDLVIIRDVGRLSKMIYWLCLAQRRAMLGYDQRPYLRPRHLGRLIHGIFRGRPFHRMTPVHGLATQDACPDRHATYLPFPVEGITAMERRSYRPHGVVRVLCVGKLAEPRKNHLLLLKALESLASDLLFSITIAGSSNLNIKNGNDGYINSLFSYAKEGFLANRLTILSDVPFPEMTKLYDQHDICVLPSQREPLGTAPLEAMGRGCAAVISSDSGSAYYVQGAELAGSACGALFCPGDAIDLASVLRRIMTEPGEIEKMGVNAARWVQQEFSLETFATRFQHLASRRIGRNPLAVAQGC